LLEETNLAKISEIKNFLLSSNFNFSESEILDVLSCIPNVVEYEVKKISENLEVVRNYFKLDTSELKNVLIHYPILICNVSSDIHKLEFYFNLYVEMNKEDFYKLVMKFPLLLTATVNLIFINFTAGQYIEYIQINR
jgi:hypothetical protein